MTSTPHRPIRRSAGLAAVAAVVAAVVLGLGGCAASDTGSGARSTPTASSSATSTPTPTPSASPTEDQGPQPIPTRKSAHITSLSIPAIDVQAKKFEKLELMSDGELSAPVDPDLAGYYVDGAVPGEIGPAVIAGHVDSKTGPAVFYELGDLSKGNKITIGLSNGRTVHFTVDSVLHAAKDEFPTDKVYGPTPDAQLRLITCSGTYDRGGRGYLDNTVVLASVHQ